MSLRGKIARGEKWLKIYSDSEIEKNHVFVEDVKAYVEAKGVMETKPLEEMDKMELQKEILKRGIKTDNLPIKKKDIIKLIKESE